MKTFLNIDLESKTPIKFVQKHVLFSILWVLIFAVFLFRIDVNLFSKINGLEWTTGILPILYTIFLILFTIKQKWYSIAFIFYPILALFWFIPKTILAKGKIYLFGHYINGVFKKLQSPKKSLIHLGLFIVPLILILITYNVYVRWVTVILFSYFYIRYILNYIGRSFKPAQLFGSNIETALEKIITQGTTNKSALIDSYIKQKEDEKLPINERSKKQISRLVLANHVLTFVSNNLNSYKGKRAYLIAWMYELFIFLLVSMMFFWFVNYQVYLIDPTNFKLDGAPSKFEFFYYTLKTITFGDIPSILPNSVFSKTIEIASFFVVGVFILIIAASIIFSFRQDKMKENIELTTKICADQNRIIAEYMMNEFSTDVQSAVTEFSTIKDSIEKLQRVLKNVF